MAYIPTECTLAQYEQQVYSGETDNILYIRHGNTVIGTEELGYASPYASSFTWKRRIIDNGSKVFKLDNFVSQEIELTLHDYEIQDLTEELEIKIGTYVESVSRYVYIPLGIYKIQDSPTSDNGTTTYKLFDRSVNFDFGYNGKPLIDNSEHLDENNEKYVTKLEVLLDICTQAGVNYVGSRTFAGYDDKLAIYDNTVSGRIYVSYIAEQCGCIATINREGNLDFVQMNNNLTTRILDEDIIESFKSGDSYTISKVIYESGTTFFPSGDDTYDTLFINGANPYITKVSDIDRIYNLINGFSIDSFRISKMLGNPTIDPYDIIELTYENNTYRTLAQYTLTFSGTMVMNFDTTIEHGEKQVNTTINGQAIFKKYIKQEIDNVSNQVTTVVGSVDTAIDGVSNLNTRVDGIENTNEEIERRLTSAETSITQTDSDWKAQITQVYDDLGGEPETLKNNLVTININGISVSTDTSAIQTLMANNRFTISDGYTDFFYVGYNENTGKTESRMDNLTVTNYLTTGNHRIENYEVSGEARTGFFYVG